MNGCSETLEEGETLPRSKIILTTISTSVGNESKEVVEEGWSGVDLEDTSNNLNDDTYSVGDQMSQGYLINSHEAVEEVRDGTLNPASR